MIDVVFGVMAPVALILLVGIAWDRLRQPFDAAFVGNLVYYVGGPCLTFSTLVDYSFTPGVRNLALATVAALAAFGVAGAIALRLMRLDLHSYLNTIMFPNLGNMGLPVALFAFGEPGLALAVVVFTIGSVAHSSVGIWIASGRLAPTELFKAPLLYATLLALAGQAGLEAPTFVLRATEILGDLTIPMMLLSLGVSLSRLKITNTQRAATLAGLRLGIGLAGGLLAAWTFGLSPLERGVLVLDAVMPAAVFNYLLAERFKTAPEDVAGGVALSTLASFVVLPLVLTFAL
jgi:predicted permease